MTQKIFKIFTVGMVCLSLAVTSLPALADEGETGAETTSKVNFVGTLIEVGSTEVPTTIIVRSENVDYTIDVTVKTVLGERWDKWTNLSDWIPGDAIRVVGVKNENTGVIDATILVNKSIIKWTHRGVNGWISALDPSKKQVSVVYGAAKYTLQVNDSTNIQIPGRGKVTFEDLKVGDRVRARVLKRVGDSVLDAKIIIVLRRGNVILQKLRTNVFNAELLEIAGIEPPTTIKVKILASPALKSGDANNLIGAPGDEKTININEKTVLVRRWFGKTTLDEFTPGDKLMIVGRANDDGTIEAKLVRDNDIWRVTSKGIPGEITAIDTANNQFTVLWLASSVTVKVTSSTKIVVNGEVGDISDLKVGDKVRGRGVWNALTKILTADAVVVVKSL
jgi:hypothetical protein